MNIISFYFQGIERLRSLALPIAFVLCLLLAHSVHAAEIIVLHSGSGPTPWTQKLVEGVESELGAGTLIKQEYLGGGSNNEDHFDAEYERLARIYAQATPMAVLADGRIAFAFMRKYREDLFPDAPVVFCSMSRPKPELLSQCGECTGIPLELNVRATIDLIFAIRPDTRTVVGIMDATPTSQTLRGKAEAAMEPYMDRAQLVFPGHEPGDDAGLDMEILATVASSVPGSGAVLFLGFNEDRTGKPADERQAIELLSTRSDGPTFVLTDTWIGSGILGGWVATGKAQGRAVARVVKRIQAGESPQEMLPQPMPSQLVADATILTRFGLDEHMPLLSNARIINKPVRPSEPDSITSTGALSTVLGLIVFVGLLYVLRRFTSRKSR